jgi:ELWxxDGT repeat protein
MKTIRCALALAAALAPATAFATVPYLVDDIDPRFVSNGSQPHSFASLGGRAVFLTGLETELWGTAGVPGDPVLLGARDQRVFSGPTAAGGRAYFTRCGDGCGLWATDGTPAGTIRLVPFHSTGFTPLEAVAPAGLPRTLLLANAGNLTALWRTDGTPAGTRKVGMPARNPRGLVAFRGKGWFFADLPNAAGALFTTDGLPGGTRRVGTSTSGLELTPFGDRLLYFAGEELWTTDGTPAGTRRLAILPGSSNDFFQPIVVATGRSFFFRFNAGLRELWTTDGTPAGTRLVVAKPDIGADLAALGGKVAFLASTPERGQELWASDGTAAGTRGVKEICAGFCNGAWRFGISALGRIWFSGGTPDRGIEAWTSNLTAAGTHQLRDLCPGSCSTDPLGWYAAGGRVYFLADDGLGARTLYASDGTAAGTGAIGTAPQFASTLRAVPIDGAKIVFSGGDFIHGVEPWVSDGTAAGTGLLADLDADNQVGSNPSAFSAAGGRAFFFADDGEHGRELWASDGTAGGTRLVYELEPGPDSAQVSDVLAQDAGGRLVLFAGSSRFGGFDLIGSDGTPAGTERSLPDGVRVPDGRRVQAGGKVFFIAEDSVHGAELWATDGTAFGTLRLTDLVPPAPFRPDSGPLPALFALDDFAVVPVLSPLGGEELWISGGNVFDTRSIDEIFPFLDEPLELAKSPIAQLGGKFWFVAANPGDGAATLLRTDLTAFGTASVAPLDLSNPTAGGWSLFPLGTRMLAFGPSDSLGTALWSSDGTVVGTHVLGSAPFDRFVPPVAFAGRLWYSNRNFGTLWSTDGTAAGTVQAMDSAGQPIRATFLAVLGGRLVIRTESGFFDSDGTPAGTLTIELPGQPDRFSLQGVAAGDRVYFVWDDLSHGPELWALRPE